MNHLAAVKAFQKAGFRILRQGKHIIMSNDDARLIIPRHNPIDSITMGGLIADAGLTNDEFTALLK